MRTVEAKAGTLYPEKMMIKLALLSALVAGSAFIGGCSDKPVAEERFTQAAEYDSVLQTDHSARSWKKISRAPSAIASPTPAP